MKITTRIFTAIAALMLLSTPIYAQTSQNVFKVNLLSPLLRSGSFFYERAINEDVSLQLGFFYSGATISQTTFRGFGITPEARYYLSEKPAPAGVFVAPYLRYQSFSLTGEESSNEATYSSFGGGLLIGTQAIFKDRISLEAFIGPSYSSGSLKVTSGDADDFNTGVFDGFGVRFGVTVGLAF